MAWWKPAWFQMRTLALIEPTTSVLIYPLIADLFLRSSLAVTCHIYYVTVFFILQICITISSLILVKYSTEQISRLLKCNGSEKAENFNKLYFTGIIWNTMFSYLVVVFDYNKRDSEEPSAENCFPAPKYDNALWTGLKSIVPQTFTLVLLIGVVIAALVMRRTTGQLKYLPTDLESSKRWLWAIVKPITIAFLFQLLYFGLRLGFVFCSCGWFKMESRLMDVLTCTCLLKSAIVVAFVSARCHYSANYCPPDSYCLVAASNGDSRQTRN